MKTYTKKHKTTKVAKLHASKIRKRGGMVLFDSTGKELKYSFPSRKIAATNKIALIKEAAKKGYRKVKISFHAPIKNLTQKQKEAYPKNLLDAMRKEKTIILDVVKEGGEIIQLKKSKDVKTIKYV